jgi:acyl transferase domain-containing protein
LVTPSQSAQEEVVNRALRQAGVAPEQVDYIEAHGTGTPVGDEVELAALRSIMGRRKPPSPPCLVGSLKSNLGHTGVAAGLVGLIKVALSLRHLQIPASLHSTPLRDALNTPSSTLRIPETTVPWLPQTHGAATACVSAFGFTGTVAHAVLQEAPSYVKGIGYQPEATVLTISARDAHALAALAERYRERLELGSWTEGALERLCRAAATRRTHHSHRLSIVGQTPRELTEALGVGVQAAQLRPGRRLAFVFPGQGSQWAGMGIRLCEREHTFGSAMAACAEAASPELGRSLLDVLACSADRPEWDDISLVQPLLVAFQIALAKLYRSWGLHPDVVLGTSMGEIAAAHFAGALTLKDAMRVVVRRSRLLKRLEGRGSMVLAECAAEKAERLISEFGLELVVAVDNGPASVVLAGPNLRLASDVARLEALGIPCRPIKVSIASHSPQVDTILPELAQALAGLEPSATTIPLVSTVIGHRVDGGELDATYWLRNLREPVRLATTVRSLLAEEDHVFLELSPHPVLLAPLLDSIQQLRSTSLAVSSLVRDRAEQRCLAESLSTLYGAGVGVSWRDVLGPGDGDIELPRYPWQEEEIGVDEATLRDSTGSETPARPDAFAQTPAVQERQIDPQHETHDTRVNKLRLQVARTLGVAPEAVGVNVPFRELGLSSLMLTELRVTAGKLFGQSVSSSMFFSHPSIEALCREMSRAPAPRSAPTRDFGGAASVPSTAIAIVGIGCRFPGGANDPRRFWKLLASGHDAIVEIPSERWDLEEFYDPDPGTANKSYVRWAGLIDHIHAFDAELFAINRREAEAMDPQQRLLLEVAWSALEDATQPPSKLGGTRTGVFVGAMNNNDYSALRGTSLGNKQIGAYDAVGGALSMLAGRLSYHFGLEGPSLTIDTACSSSLVAVHLGVQSLRRGECDLVLAGGVNAILSPLPMIAYCRSGMLSVRGRCRTFDEEADGYVRGEGCGTVVLKRLDDALRDGDPVRAIIRGSAVNQDGRSNGLTAPNGRAQSALIRSALADGRLGLEEVDYVEAHGTGTRLGDPIEAEALGDVFAPLLTVDRRLRVGSVKTNIGHLEAAAGIAGLIKVVLAMEHGRVPAHLHLKTPNRDIDFEGLRLEIPVVASDWPARAGRRVAGVSSFGFSGTNAHLLLERTAQCR